MELRSSGALRSAGIKRSSLFRPAVTHQLGRGGLQRRPDARPETAVKVGTVWELFTDDNIRNKDNEEAREFRRVMYDFNSWKEHRRVDRYGLTIIGMFSSRILLALAAPLKWLLVVAVGVCVYGHLLHLGLLPPDLPRPEMNTAPFTLTSFAISLLLVFRTNSAYARYDEARKAWGVVLNRCRAVAAQVCAFVPDQQKEYRLEVCKWLAGFARSLQSHIQEGVDLPAKLSPWMSQQEVDLLMTATHRPVKAMQVLNAIVDRLPVTPTQALSLRMDLALFYDQLGACERLLRTPIPLSYTRHTCRFLLIWLTFLPLALWPCCGWTTPPITLMVGALLLGIEEIGVQVEEPLGLLPVDTICSRAEADMRMQLESAGGVSSYVDTLLPPLPASTFAAAMAMVTASGPATGSSTAGNGAGSNGNGAGVAVGAQPDSFRGRSRS